MTGPHRYIETGDIERTLLEELKAIEAKHVFVVRGKNSYIFCGAADAMKHVCDELYVRITQFLDFSENPKEEEAQAGLSLLMDAKPDVIIAFGGGSAIDTAKLIRHYALTEGVEIPLWAVPTTAGTGAEATKFAVVYKNGVKHSEEAEDIQPNLAILYPPFTYRNNDYLTACTGFDALAQAIEAFWNPNATPDSDHFARNAIMHIHQNLPRCVECPNEYLRDALMKGAYLAGRAINITKTTAPHAFSYAFTSKCGYRHGHAVAITFPFFAKLNMANHPKNDELRKLLGISADMDLQEYFVRYVNRIGLRYNGTGDNDLHELLDQVNLDRLKNNPVEIKKDEIEALERFVETL